MIELAPPDPEADGPVVDGIDLSLTIDDARTKAGDWLKGPSAPIIVHVDLEVVDDLRRNPAGAYLVAREQGGVHDNDVDAGPQAFQGQREPPRSADDAHDDKPVHRALNPPYQGRFGR